MSSKKPGKPRKTRSSKPTLKKATVKDLAPSRAGGRGAKGGTLIAPPKATLSCACLEPQLTDPYKTWAQPGV